MPGFDGTGPQGKGPMTGGGRGFCYPGLKEAIPGTPSGLPRLGLRRFWPPLGLGRGVGGRGGGRGRGWRGGFRGRSS
jgi:hypothetical protein